MGILWERESLKWGFFNTNRYKTVFRSLLLVLHYQFEVLCYPFLISRSPFFRFPFHRSLFETRFSGLYCRILITWVNDRKFQRIYGRLVPAKEVDSRSTFCYISLERQINRPLICVILFRSCKPIKINASDADKIMRCERDKMGWGGKATVYCYPVNRLKYPSSLKDGSRFPGP